MKKSIALVLVLVLAMVAVFPFATTVGAENFAGDDNLSPARLALSIKAPSASTAGEKVLIKVVDRNSGAPVERAGVWALGFGNANKADTVLTTSSAIGDNPEVFLGWTNQNGELVHVFWETNCYYLASFKDKYLPGFSRINILPPKTLVIKAPESVRVGVPVQISVYERYSMSFIPGAEIWAVPALDTPVISSDPEENIALIIQNGQLLGLTDAQGSLVYKFENANKYLLIAVKNGYVPGFINIVVESEKALMIKAPSGVRVLEPFNIRVLEKSPLTVELPVSEAGVWAVNIADIPEWSNTQVSEETAIKHGIFLGRTNTDGYIEPSPSINSPGRFWLVAIKDGCTPGFSTITVKPLVTVTATPVVNKTSGTMLTYPASNAESIISGNSVSGGVRSVNTVR